MWGNKNWPTLNSSQTSTWICCGPCWIIAIIRNKIMAWHKSMKLHTIEFEVGMIRDRTEAECYSPCITFPLQGMDYSDQSDFTLLIILLTLISHFDFLKSKFLDLKNMHVHIWITNMDYNDIRAEKKFGDLWKLLFVSPDISEYVKVPAGIDIVNRQHIPGPVYNGNYTPVLFLWQSCTMFWNVLLVIFPH